MNLSREKKGPTLKKDTLKIEMAVGADRNNNDYYFATTELPMSIDLRETLFIVFPVYDDEGRVIGADMKVKKKDSKEDKQYFRPDNYGNQKYRYADQSISNYNRKEYEEDLGNE